jgi:hypothetical protein
VKDTAAACGGEDGSKHLDGSQVTAAQLLPLLQQTGCEEGGGRIVHAPRCIIPPLSMIQKRGRRNEGGPAVRACVLVRWAAGRSRAGVARMLSATPLKLGLWRCVGRPLLAPPPLRPVGPCSG